eukprot:TRINITY_DN30043_c0_g1_i2.p1 TRINITY_DN30043_c0_g1~~TRINITY_DN30043_c0_g1_i2.p1  ORF type:complete len:415 (-),score=129.39 TRINITY_DN30043_c0_g1_i2:109-1353(-)
MLRSLVGSEMCIRDRCTIEVMAQPGDPIQILNVSTELRQAIGMDIPISNPISKPIEFEVRIEGDGLLGERFITLGPHESSVYELIYSPLRPGTGDGGITFNNAEAGEFWYQINLSAVKPAPTVLDPVSCEIGKSVTFEFPLENPIDQQVQLTAFNTNPTNFQLIDDAHNMVLPPFGSRVITVRYTASAVGVPQPTSLTLKHPKVADWEFEVVGTGLAPTSMAPTLFFSPLGQSGTDPITFRNPFEHTIDVTVTLERADHTSNAFRLIGANSSGSKQLTLFEYQTVQIPVRFSPANLDDCRGIVKVTAEDGISWCFPVSGKVFVDTEVSQSLYYCCPARSSLEETMEIALPGLEVSDGKVPITFETHFNEEEENMLSRALTCLLYTSDAADEEDSVDLGGRRIIKKKKKKEYDNQ